MQYQSLQGFYKVSTLIGEGGGVRSGLVDQFQIICLINGIFSRKLHLINNSSVGF